MTLRRTLHLYLLLFASLSVLIAQPTETRIAWLTDTHVGNPTGADDLRASVADINALEGTDFVVLSGDVTEFGSDEQFRLTKSILDRLVPPYFIIPGNHDTKWSESGATSFRKFWGNDRFVFRSAGLTFIGLHQGPIMKMGDGHWAPEDLRWLDSILAHLPDPRQPIVFITHYPIDPGIANWYEVLDRLKRFNTQVVLAGHGHRNRIDDYEGIPGVMGRSNLRAGDPVGGYNLIEIRGSMMTFHTRSPGGTTEPSWHTILIEPKQYSTVVDPATRPDFSVNASYPDVTTTWEYRTGWTLASSPAVWNGLAIIGDASGTVNALDLDIGAVRWSFTAGDAVYSTPAVSDGKVAFGSCDSLIYCLDAATGKLLWSHRTGKAVVASPAIHDGAVFIGASDGKFRAFDLTTGTLKWEYPNVEWFVETKPLVTEGIVIFGAWDTYLYALDEQTGALRWKWQSDRPGTGLSPAACWPVAAHGKAFIVAPDRRMTAIDLRTGATVWRTGQWQVRETIGISEDGERVYVRTMRDSVLAISSRSEGPEIVWVQDLGFGYDINSAAIVEKDGVMFYGTKNGLLMALDGRTGTVLWKHKTGVALLNTVKPLSGFSVIAADLDGVVRLIRASR